MAEWSWAVAAIALLGGWALCMFMYQRIYGRRLRWWAAPFAQGALIFGRRLYRWEVPASVHSDKENDDA